MAYGVRYYQQSTTTGDDIRLPSVTTGTARGNDKFGNDATTDSGNVNNITWTNNLYTVSTSTGSIALSGDTYFWNRTVRNPTTNAFQTLTTNGSHANFFNCRFDIDNAGAALSGVVNGAGGGNVDITGVNESSGRSWNMYNCLVSISSPSTTAGYVFDDLFDSTISYEGGNSQNVYGLTYSKTGARLRRSSIIVPLRQSGTRTAEHTFRGIPGEVTDMVFENVRLQHLVETLGIGNLYCSYLLTSLYRARRSFSIHSQ